MSHLAYSDKGFASGLPDIESGASPVENASASSISVPGEGVLAPSSVERDATSCCDLGDEHALWRAVWKAYGEHPDPLSRERALERVLARRAFRDLGLDVAQVVHHMTFHDPVQPSAKSVFSGTAAREMEKLSDRDLDILRLVSQLTFASTEAVAQTLFSSAGEASRHRTTRHVLLRLVRREYLFRARTKALRGRAGMPQHVFALAPLGAAVIGLLQEHGERPLKLRAVRNASETQHGHFLHDGFAGEVLANLAADAIHNPVQTITVKDRERVLDLHVSPYNLLGSRQLAMGHRQPLFFERVGGATATSGGQMNNLTPDGFVAVGVRENASGLDALLPLLVEFDTGLIVHRQVIHQLFEYSGLAYSGAPYTRFPELAHAGGYMPLLVVTQGVTSRGRGPVMPATGKPSGTLRVGRLAVGLRTKLAAVRFQTPGVGPVPVYLTTHAEAREYGWQTPVICAHRKSDTPVPLIKAMLRDYAQVLASPPVGAEHVVTPDRSGAKPHIRPRTQALTPEEEKQREAALMARDRQVHELALAQRQHDITRGDAR